MTAVAVSVDSRDCTTPGCAGEAAWASGPDLGLCCTCASAARRARRGAANPTARRARYLERVRARYEQAVADAAAAIYAYDTGEAWASLDDDAERAYYVGRAQAAIAALGIRRPEVSDG